MLRQTLARSLFRQTIPLLLIGRALAKLEKAPVGLVNHSFYNETGGIAPKWVPGPLSADQMDENGEPICENIEHYYPTNGTIWAPCGRPLGCEPTCINPNPICSRTELSWNFLLLRCSGTCAGACVPRCVCPPERPMYIKPKWGETTWQCGALEDCPGGPPDAALPRLEGGLDWLAASATPDAFDSEGSTLADEGGLSTGDGDKTDLFTQDRQAVATMPVDAFAYASALLGGTCVIGALVLARQTRRSRGESALTGSTTAVCESAEGASTAAACPQPRIGATSVSRGLQSA